MVVCSMLSPALAAHILPSYVNGLILRTQDKVEKNTG